MTTTTATQPEYVGTWTPQEIAYRLPNPRRGYAMGEWKRVMCKTVQAFDKKIANLEERDAEICVRDLEVAV